MDWKKESDRLIEMQEAAQRGMSRARSNWTRARAALDAVSAKPVEALDTARKEWREALARIEAATKAARARWDEAKSAHDAAVAPAVAALKAARFEKTRAAAVLAERLEEGRKYNRKMAREDPEEDEDY